MIANINKYFLKADAVDETYIFLLRIFQYTADIEKKLAEKYRKGQIDTRLIEHIKDKLIIYKQFGSLSEESAEEGQKGQDVKQLEFKILSAEIDCLKELLKAKLSETDNFLDDEIHEEILGVIALNQVDPILLISCCKYATEYFTERNVITSSTICSKKLAKLDNCVKLLPYLGGSSYEKALERCEQYLNIDFVASMKKEQLNLEDQHNPLMNELLIAIINLIELVSLCDFTV